MAYGATNIHIACAIGPYFQHVQLLILLSSVLLGQRDCLIGYYNMSDEIESVTKNWFTSLHAVS